MSQETLGDETALRAAEHIAPAPLNEGFAELRSKLQGPPSEELWSWVSRLTQATSLSRS